MDGSTFITASTIMFPLLLRVFERRIPCPRDAGEFGGLATFTLPWRTGKRPQFFPNFHEPLDGIVGPVLGVSSG
jgi:hypothetical protein